MGIHEEHEKGALMSRQERDTRHRQMAAKELQQARMLLRVAVDKLNECEATYLGEDDPEKVALLADEALAKSQYAVMCLTRMMGHTLRRVPPGEG